MFLCGDIVYEHTVRLLDSSGETCELRKERCSSIIILLNSPPEWIVKNGPHDLILIDGPTGYDLNQPGRLLPIAWLKYTTKSGTVAYVDDYFRRYEIHCTNTLFKNNIHYIFPKGMDVVV